MVNAQTPGQLDADNKLQKPSVVSEKPKESPLPAEQAPEHQPEQPEQPQSRGELPKPSVSSALSKTPTPAPAPTPSNKSEARREIEQILQEDLSELYANLDEKQRQDFRLKGEETATQIERLIETAKITTRKVIRLLKDWLKLLPQALNAFFFEQVVKIKTDRLMAFNEKVRKDHLDQF